MWLKIEILWFWMTNSYEKFMCFWFQSLSLWTLWTKPISMIIILSASVCWSLVIFCFVFIPSNLLFLKALKQSHPITLITIVSPSFHFLIVWSLIILFFLFHLLSVFTWWSVKWKLKEVHLWCKSWTRESRGNKPSWVILLVWPVYMALRSL